MKKGKWILKWVVAGILFLLVLGTVTMFLWNWLVPSLFKGPELSLPEAFGLLLLTKILFSGWGRGRWGHGGPAWRHRYYEKLSSMTPEERERFKSRMREKWCSPARGRQSDDAATSNV